MRQLSDLENKNIVVFDLEIKVPIEKCPKGWSDYATMGISVGCAFDYRDMRYRVFLDDNISELANRLNEPGTLVVAFNNIGFDNRLLKAHCPQLRDDLKNYDLMRVSKRALGIEHAHHKGFRLDDHLAALRLTMKSDNGANAPLWWQEGKIGKTIDYCLNDVKVERSLFEYAYVTGKMACAFQPVPYEIELPCLESA